MYRMLESYGPYKRGKTIIVVEEGHDWVRTNKGYYIPKFLVDCPETEIREAQK